MKVCPGPGRANLAGRADLAMGEVYWGLGQPSAAISLPGDEGISEVETVERALPPSPRYCSIVDN